MILLLLLLARLHSQLVVFSGLFYLWLLKHALGLQLFQ